MLATAWRYWNTLRHLKTVQIVNRLWRNIDRAHPKVEGGFALRCRLAAWEEPARVASFMRGPDAFEFLGVRRSVRGERDWNQDAWPLLWRYHLHYFDDLNARDWRARAHWHAALIERWIAQNPPAVGVGWDPYPTSLRVVNWIKWWLGGAVPAAIALDSARLQLARVMSRLEYHLLGNHLLENAKALVFGGLFFEGDLAERWLNRGLKILARQLPEQILDDGGHFERSPMYHQIVLAGLIDLHNILRVYGRTGSLDLVPCIERMLRWSAHMSHPDGDIALFNDAALHEAHTPRCLENYAARLGIEVQATGGPETESTVVQLASSGYVRVTFDPYIALLNIGSVAPKYQPGHAHADTLSFELSSMGRRLIVDSGTSTYEQGARRDWERGSAAHNTVMVNGVDSSVMWGGYRVARRARILSATVRADGAKATIAASHDGYRRLAARAIHERRWEFSAGEVRIEDLIDGRGEVDLDLILNIHPDFELTQISDAHFEARSAEGAVHATFDTPRGLRARIAEFSFAPQFGCLRPGARIVARARVRLPRSLTTIIRLRRSIG